MRWVAFDVPTTAGSANSRATTAGCAGHAAGVGDEAADLREEHDPGRVRHAADEDVARLHLVELLERLDDARGPLDDAGRGGEADDLSRETERGAVELLREAPQREVRERERVLGRRADPVGRADLEGGLAGVAPLADIVRASSEDASPISARSSL